MRRTAREGTAVRRSKGNGFVSDIFQEVDEEVRRDLCDVAVSSNAPDVHDEVNRKSDGFADTPMRQPDVRCQYAVGQACEGLF